MITWKNYGLITAKNKDVEHFTTENGIRFRKKIYSLLREIVKKNTGKKTILVSYPELEKEIPYIFAAGHSFPGEVATNLSVIDRPTYTLVGTTDQVDHNPQMYLLWIIGMIYVNKKDPISRKDSFQKMKRVLNSNTSVMLFPEGVLNNSENLDCMPLYPGIYHLAKETKKKIVPIVSNYDYENNAVLVAASNPIDFSQKEKKEALQELRDNLASLRFNLSRISIDEAISLKKVILPEQLEKLNPKLKIELERSSLFGDIHLNYMEHRKEIYNEVKWSSERVFEEEIMTYKDKDITTFDEVYSFIENIDLSEKSVEIQQILNPILQKKIEYKKYNFKEYMKKNWNK